MRRFSIRTLMAFVLVSAIGLAALRNASDLWAGMMLLLALAAVGIAVMGSVILRGCERCWCAGFAFFGGGYLALAVGPWLSPWFRTQLGTTQLLDYVQSQVETEFDTDRAQASTRKLLASLRLQRAELTQELESANRITRASADPALVALTRRIVKIDQGIEALSNPPPPPANRWRSALPGAAHHDQFQSVGHSLFALLAGLLGGMVARWLHARREQTRATGETAGLTANPPVINPNDLATPT